MSVLPPTNEEAERVVLGALLVEPGELDTVAAFLTPAAFSQTAYATVYRALLALHEQGSPVDFLTVCDLLERQGTLNGLGGVPFVAELVRAVPTSAHVEHYARLVADCAAKRQIIRVGGQIGGLGYDTTLTAAEALAKAETLLSGVELREQTGSLHHIGAAVSETLTRLERLAEQKGQVLGVPSGFTDLDRVTGGWQPSDLILLAARPSVGKTAMGLAWAYWAASHNVPTLFFSLEMSLEQITQRLLAARSGVDTGKLRRAWVEHDWPALTEAEQAFQQVALWVDDQAGLTIGDLHRRARRAYRDWGVRLLLVDYVGLLRGVKAESRTQEVSVLSSELKRLAKDLSVPVIALSQFNRQVEGRPGKKPMLSDLRDSGSLEQDADLVLALWRDEDDQRDPLRAGVVHLAILKHRNGPLAEWQYRLIGHTQQFVPVERG